MNMGLKPSCAVCRLLRGRGQVSHGLGIEMVWKRCLKTVDLWSTVPESCVSTEAAVFLCGRTLSDGWARRGAMSP